MNINGYIKKQAINKETEKYNIKIKVIDIDYYRDYSICNIQVLNKNDTTILLDSRRKEKSLYLTNNEEDEEDIVKFYSYAYELNDNELKVIQGENKKISIKFSYYYNYREDISLGEMRFNDIIIDYNKYKNNEIEEENIKTISVDL